MIENTKTNFLPTYNELQKLRSEYYLLRKEDRTNSIDLVPMIDNEREYYRNPRFRYSQFHHFQLDISKELFGLYTEENKDFESSMMNIKSRINNARRIMWINFIQTNYSKLVESLPFDSFFPIELKTKKIKLRKKGIDLILKIQNNGLSNPDIYLQYMKELWEFEEELSGVGTKWIIGIWVTIFGVLVGGTISIIGTPYEEMYRNLGYFILVIFLTAFICVLGIIFTNKKKIKIFGNLLKNKKIYIVIIGCTGIFIGIIYLLESDNYTLFLIGVGIVGGLLLPIILIIFVIILILILDLLDTKKNIHHKRTKTTEIAIDSHLTEFVDNSVSKMKTD